jgi:hypothetical protein
MSAFLEETVLSVHHWTDRLFSFTTTRDTALRFSNGHFTMIGLRGEGGKPLLRAYSIASANYEEHLEFLSIKVPNGPLTSKLQHIQVGDKIVVGRKPTGTLLIDYLLKGKNLYLIGTGTGVAPLAPCPSCDFVFNVTHANPTEATTSGDCLGLMDIAAVQWRFERTGLINRIDLRLAQGTDLQAFQQKLQAQLPPDASACRSPIRPW